MEMFDLLDFLFIFEFEEVDPEEDEEDDLCLLLYVSF